MIECMAIHHVSLTVLNLDEAKTFYREILKLQELPRPDFDFEGAWFQVGNQHLHLIVDANHNRKSQKINSRDPHFAIRVSDYHKTVEWLQQNKIEIAEKPQSKSGFAQIFCFDPAGNLIELNVEQKDLK